MAGAVGEDVGRVALQVVGEDADDRLRGQPGVEAEGLAVVQDRVRIALMIPGITARDVADAGVGIDLEGDLEVGASATEIPSSEPAGAAVVIQGSRLRLRREPE